MKHVYSIIGLLLISLNALAGPNISPGTVYDYMDADKSTYLKRIFNGGSSTAFVRIKILEIIYKPDGTSEEVPLKAQGGSVRDGLMASPARLIIPANSTQGSRLLFMGNRDHERYFRVRFIPVVPEKEDEFALNQEQAEDYKKTLSAGVSVLAGYGTIFMVRPKNIRVDTRIDDTKTQYSIKNNGNTVVLVDDFKDCSIKDSLECKPVTKTHILPGRTYQFSKEPGRHYRFTLIEANKQKIVEVKG